MFFDGEGMCWFPGGNMQKPGEQDLEKQALLTSHTHTHTHTHTQKNNTPPTKLPPGICFSWNLHRLECAQLKVVLTAPKEQLLNLPPVCSLITHHEADK